MIILVGIHDLVVIDKIMATIRVIVLFVISALVCVGGETAPGPPRPALSESFSAEVC